MITVALTLMLLAQGPSLSQGRTVARAAQGQESSRLWALGGAGLKAQYGSEGALAVFLNRLVYDFGKELRVISEGLSTRDDGTTTYRRVANISNYARGMVMEVQWDAQGRLQQLTAQPAAQAAPTTTGGHRTKAALHLPFDGSWYVLWGGRSYGDNHHSAVSDQRFALDLLIYKGQKTADGEGLKNEEYYCWGLPVKSPGQGRVVTAVDGVPDNEPNRPRAGNLYGNYVVIDHGTGEYSLLAHMMKGTVKVREGELVAPGTVLGLTGSSGMSTEPHIHYQLMNKADWMVADGLPAQFREYFINGALVRKGEPRRNEVIAPASLEASSTP